MFRGDSDEPVGTICARVNPKPFDHNIHARLQIDQQGNAIFENEGTFNSPTLEDPKIGKKIKFRIHG